MPSVLSNEEKTRVRYHLGYPNLTRITTLMATVPAPRQLEFLQLDGVGPKASQLLIAAGVASVKELAGRAPASLLPALAAANEARAIAGVNPSIEHVTQWVEAAKKASLHLIEE